MFGSTNYDALSRQQMTQQQANMNMVAQNQTITNIQMSKVRQMYPQAVMLRQTPTDQQHRVPLMLPISPVPLYIKITLALQFPMVAPKVHMMSSVTHQHVDAVTYEYRGPAVQGWNGQTSSLANVIKAIHEEFKATPPMPRAMGMAGSVARHVVTGAMAGGAQQAAHPQQPSGAVEFQEKQRYSGETVTLAKPTLNELRQEVARMDPSSIAKLEGAALERKAKYFEQAEVRQMQATVKRLVGELQAQTEENCEERGQLSAIWDQYDSKFAQHQSLEETNRALRQQVEASGANSANDKATVMGLLSQKASAAEAECRATEKAFIKRESDLRDFLDTYVKQRSEYHKYQLLKVKVHQS